MTLKEQMMKRLEKSVDSILEQVECNDAQAESFSFELRTTVVNSHSIDRFEIAAAIKNMTFNR